VFLAASKIPRYNFDIYSQTFYPKIAHVVELHKEVIQKND